jgi:NMD protein affecting ribosome stability and mRNA decay
MAPGCHVCGDPIGDGYTIERLWLHGLGLCAKCAVDDGIVARVEARVEYYAAKKRLPSWWEYLWLTPLDAAIVTSEHNRRRKRDREAKAKKARRNFIQSE